MVYQYKLKAKTNGVTFDLLIILLIFSLIPIVKSFLLRMTLLVNAYPIMVVFAYKHGFPVGGLLSAIGGRYYTDQIVSSAFYWQVIGYLFLFLILLPIRNNIPKFQVLPMRDANRMLLLLLLILSAVIAYPSSFHISNQRFNLLPGNGWGSVYTALTVIFLLTDNGRGWISRLHVLLVLLLIVSGNRADNILVLLYLMVYRGLKLKTEHFSYWKIAIPFSIIFVIGVMVGVLRFSSFSWELAYSAIFYGLYSQVTAVDAVNTYLSSVWYYYMQEPNWILFANTPFTILPATPLGGGNSPYNYVIFLSEFIRNYGGGMFYAEGAMNLGLLGVLLYNIIYGIFIRIVLRFDSILNSVLIILLFLLQLRIQWYGMLFLIKPLLLVVMSILFYTMALKLPMVLRYSKTSS